MAHNFIKRPFTGSISFFEINQKIIDWDYSDLEGEGFYYKHFSGKYGHVKLKISKVENIESTDNIFVEWHKETLIPNEYRDVILDTIGFFISYLEGLKGKNQSLKIEILDGSYHVVDSKNLAYEIATLFALHDCFGNLKREIAESDRRTIANFKEMMKNL